METHSTPFESAQGKSSVQANKPFDKTQGKGKILLNTIFWGFILWLFGYILGFVFFALVSKEMIGWYVMPLGIVATLFVLFKWIKREEFLYFIGLGVIWTIMAVVLDYFFIVKMLNSPDYYRLDVYLYYALTFILPVAVGWYKKSKGLVK
jgi:hypothetical protein